MITGDSTIFATRVGNVTIIISRNTTIHTKHFKNPISRKNSVYKMKPTKQKFFKKDPCKSIKAFFYTCMIQNLTYSQRCSVIDKLVDKCEKHKQPVTFSGP